jgi:uncharacterized protein YjbI with pentapeptide repeats
MTTEIRNSAGTVLYSGTGALRELLVNAVRGGADLSGAYLSWANLIGADLIGAYLSGAYLSWANLSGANLSGANLSGAYLSGANLSWANLSRANLSWANLSLANLGDGVLINRVTVRWLAPLCFSEGYSKTLCDVDGVAWILAGCRWFTLAEARKHWAERDDRPITRAMLEGIAAVAKLRGLKESAE